MIEEDKESVKSFKYQKDVENRVGKRTGHYVRKSNIHRQFDGLHDVNDYFDTNTDKTSVVTTEDLESSLTSDIIVESSDTELMVSRGTTPKTKLKAEKRRRKLEMSSQMPRPLIQDFLESNTQSQAELSQRRESLTANLMGKSFLTKGRESLMTTPMVKNVEDDTESPPVPGSSDFYSINMTNTNTIMTNLTKTPSVSISLEEEPNEPIENAVRNLNILETQKKEFDSYYEQLQSNPKLMQMRSVLKQMQEGSSQDILELKPSDSTRFLSPVSNVKLNMTTFSILETTNKKDNTHNKSIEIAKVNEDSIMHESFVNHNDRVIVRKSDIFNEASKELLESKENIPPLTNGIRPLTGRSKEEKIQGSKLEPIAEKKQEKKQNSKQFEEDLSEINLVKNGNQKIDKKSEVSEIIQKKTKKNSKSVDNEDKEEEKFEKIIPSKKADSEPETVLEKKKLDKRKDSRSIEEEPPKVEPTKIGKKKDEQKPEEVKGIKKTKEVKKQEKKKNLKSSEGEFESLDTFNPNDDHFYDDYNDQNLGNDLEMNESEKKYSKIEEEKTPIMEPKNKGKKKIKIEESDSSEKKVKVVKDKKKDSSRAENNKESKPEKQVKEEIKSEEEFPFEPNKKKLKGNDEGKKKENPIKIKLPPKKTEINEKIKVEKNPKKRNLKRKAPKDILVEKYEQTVGSRQLHLVNKPVPKKDGPFFADGRYPRRTRVPAHCFWKGEGPVYKNLGGGLEVVAVRVDAEGSSPLYSIAEEKTNGRRKLVKNSRKISISEESDEDFNVENETEEDMTDEIVDKKRLEPLKKMKWDFQTISEDKDKIVVLLKLGPKQEKEPQKNVAASMNCSVIKCEDRKVVVNSEGHEYILSMNDKFSIPANGIYSIYNKSKNKPLEISCNIMKK